MRVLGELFEAVEAETPYGGRAVSWEPLGAVWLKVEGRRRRERSEAEGAVAFEVATAEVRTDPRLVEGRVIRFGGADWTIRQVDVEAERPGRSELQLERTR
ncbi:phage head-tail adapter protein [Brevundimonas sp. AAP58]|uniref:phage head completion protein n=1 Tax=Brevundimonas sp. AAP58 TaxID=1523422 RepID=UPI0006B9AB95|nr:head-tail adaptor protein [Brevundimonas sp. AAP58]KPF78318.1 phage head-tail adapter protein [Brevundimonas sp. AAP58]